LGPNYSKNPFDPWSLMKTFTAFVAGLLMVLLMTASIGITPAWAKIYKWKDENGKTHFTDSPSKIPMQFRKKTGNDTSRKKTTTLKKQKSTLGTFESKKTSAFDKDNVMVEYNYYDIRGNKADELRKQLDALGPFSEKNRRNYDGLTRWQVSWKSKYRYQGDECLEFKVSTQAQITYTMPKWVNYQKGPVSLRKRWDKYYNALDTHEQGHGKHGVMALKEIERSLPKIENGKSCQELEQAFKEEVDDIIGKYNRIDVKYDEETQHGFTQGAIFP